MDIYAQVAMLQLAIMIHRLFMLDNEVQARQRRRAKRFWVRSWLSAERKLQFGHYDQLLRELRMEDSSSFFNYMRMQPLIVGEILNSVSPRTQENDTHFRKALEPGLELERIMR